VRLGFECRRIGNSTRKYLKNRDFFNWREPLENDFELHFQQRYPSIVLRRPPRVIVCHCHGVTERAIRQAVRQGACSRGQVAGACAAGSSCGGCSPVIEAILNTETRSEAPAPIASLRQAAVAAS
jgi:bacterioferritin-associated ferredoxin